MSDPTAGPTGRLLALLSLLQARRQWPGAVLAGRLEVTERTVRRDWVAARLWLCDQMDVACDEERSDSDSKA